MQIEDGSRTWPAGRGRPEGNSPRAATKGKLADRAGLPEEVHGQEVKFEELVM